MGYDMSLVGRPGTHSKNIWGMRTVRNLMDMFGMGYWESKERPWPKHDKFTSEEYEQYDETIDKIIGGQTIVDVDTKLVLAARATVEHLKYCEPDKGIAFHKLCSNDGWWVTRDECRKAIEIYNKVPDEMKLQAWADVAAGGGGWDKDNPDQVREWFENWVKFLSRGAEGQGFRVW